MALVDISNDSDGVRQHEPTKKKKQPNSSDPVSLGKALRSFFAQGQRYPLTTFCNRNGYESIRVTMHRRIKSNSTLSTLSNLHKNKQSDRGCTFPSLSVYGFSARQSQDAFKAIASMFPSSGRIVEQKICIGVGSNKAEHLFQHDRAEYDKQFARSHNLHQSNQCQLRVPSTTLLLEEGNWVKRGSQYRCRECNNACAHLHRMKLRSKERNLQVKLELIEKLNVVSQECSGSPLMNNVRARTYTELLIRVHGMSEILLQNGTLIRRCQGQVKGGDRCDKLIVSGKRANNRTICQNCTKNIWNTNKDENTRKKNYEKQIHPSSRLAHCHLTHEQRCARNRKKRDHLCNITCSYESLKSKLAKKQTFIDKELLANTGRKLSSRGKRRHENFKRQTKDCINIILNQKESFEDILKKLLLELFREGFARERRVKNGYEFKEEDVKPIVEQIFEQMNNEVKTKTGKKPKFSASTYHISHALFTRSPSHYREFKELSNFHYPSISSLEKIKGANRVSAGRESRAYENYLVAKQSRNEDQVSGFLMYDEMKIHEGVVWSSQSGLAIGLAEDMLDLKTLLERLLSDGGNTVEGAKYVNQWMYIKLNAGKYDKIMAGFWFNEGSLTGDTILNQFTNVVLSLETIKCRVLGVVSDAGGSNASFVSRLRSGKRLKEGWLDEEDCYIQNPFDKSRRIYFWFCVTHLMKSVRGQIKSSQDGRSRAFLDKNDTKFGWQVLIDFLEKKETSKFSNIISNGCRVCEKVVYPTRHLAMNVSLALRASEDNTLAALLADACQHKFVRITAKALKLATASAKKSLPFTRTKNNCQHHPWRRHGEHLIEVRYLQERAKMLEEIHHFLDEAVEEAGIDAKQTWALQRKQAGVGGNVDGAHLQTRDNLTKNLSCLRETVVPVLRRAISLLVITRPLRELGDPQSSLSASTYGLVIY